MRHVSASLLVLLGACASPSPRLSDADERAVRALEEAYRSGWLANDSAAVMETLAPGAVLMPAGMEPLVGDSAIRSYWWPGDGSETIIDGYEIALDEVDGSGTFAFVRGRGSLRFRYISAAGDTIDSTSEAVHLSLAQRGADGQWRIARRAWSRLP